MSYEQIKTNVDNGILTITLYRPEKLNAYTEQMAYELVDVFQKANKDDEVKCIVVTGEGKDFCAGADLSTFQDIANTTVVSPDDIATKDWKHHAADLVLSIYHCLKPVIGAVQGAAVGVGSTMLLPMDIRLAEENTRFGFIFNRIGLVPEACSTWFLPRIVGMSKASEWMITGRKFKADEAKAAGFVTKVTTFEDLLPTAYEIAHDIVSHTSPVSVALTRQMLWRMLLTNDPYEAKDIEHKLFIARLLNHDAKEAFQAFFEKRSPHFTSQVSKDMPTSYPWWNQ